VNHPKEMSNYYEALEVPTNASQKEIYEGYIRAQNAYSGDSIALYSLLTEQECTQIISLIEEAYSILSIPEKRKEYDKVRGLNQNKSTFEETDESYNPHKKKIVQPNPYVNKPGTVSNHLESSLNDYVQKEQSQVNTNNQRSRQNNMQPNYHVSNYASGQQEEYLRQDNDEFHLNRREVRVSKFSANQRFALKYNKDSDFEQEIENCSQFTGEYLKKIREYKNVTLERMSDMTKISKTYIKYIEDNNYEKLPAVAYVRGFVFQYAKCLKLSPDIVATSYTHYIKALISDNSEN
jgi:curved DNA-binding protein CbpA